MKQVVNRLILAALVSIACGPHLAAALDAVAAIPKPIPQTRPEMKHALEILKQRQPRLPLSPVTDEERAAAGERNLVNNGRMRAKYLPAEWQNSNNNAGPNAPDPVMSLDDTFKVRLFWIVSRGNNCHYCLGHQEHKLLSAGMDEDSIAALDCRWDAFPAEEQGAMELARKITIAPQTLTAEELDKLRAQYTPSQWIELVLTVSNFNSTNRWTDSMGIPQDQQFRDGPLHFETPTSSEFANVPTKIFPDGLIARPPLESRAEAEVMLTACRQRQPRAELLSEEKARAALPADWSKDPLPQYVRALAWFPTTGVNQIKTLRTVRSTGKISPRLKAQLAWIDARQNRAWYSTGDALRRLKSLGLSADEVFALDGDWKPYTPAEQEAFAFSRKLTAASQTIVDDDIARLRKHYSDNEVAEVVFVTCQNNMFDRFTEVLNLQLEE